MDNTGFSGENHEGLRLVRAENSVHGNRAFHTWYCGDGNVSGFHVDVVVSKVQTDFVATDSDAIASHPALFHASLHGIVVEIIRNPERVTDWGTRP